MDNVSAQETIGERKAIVRRIDASHVMFVGLLDRTEWQTRKSVAGESILTLRAFLASTRAFTGNAFPEVGFVFPSASMRNRSGIKRSGKAMATHLDTIKARAKAEHDALAILTGAKVRIY